MKQAIVSFCEHLKRKGYSPQTVRDYDRVLSVFYTHIRDLQGTDIAVRDIDKHMIHSFECFVTRKKNSSGQPISVSRKHAYLCGVKAFFAYCEKQELVFANPCVHMAIPKRKHRIIKDVLRNDQVQALLSAAGGSDFKSIRDRAVMELLYSTGIRAEECANIQVRDVNLKERVLFVRKAKLCSERMVPFGEAAGHWVSTYLERVRPLLVFEHTSIDLLFVSIHGKRLRPETFNRIIKPYAVKAGIGHNVTTHTFRHTCATHMLRGKADIRFVQKQLGHKDISTTEKYLRLEISDLQEVHKMCHPREQEDWID